MAKEDFQTSEHILGKFGRFKDASEAEIDAAVERLTVPLVDVEYKNRGEINIEGKGWGIHVAYEPVSTSWVREMGDGAKWRQFSALNVTTEKGTVDILGMLPAGEQIYLHPEPHTAFRYLRQGLVQDGRGILLWGDIAEPATLAIFFHELGHIVDVDQLNSSGLIDLFVRIDSHEYSAEAAVLRRERVASAFALKVMRPFLTNGQRADMLLFMKSYALKNYYTEAQREISSKKATKAAITHQALSDYETDMAWIEAQQKSDDYLEWKQTPDYVEWKARNPSVADHDEYAEWEKMQEDDEL